MTGPEEQTQRASGTVGPWGPVHLFTMSVGKSADLAGARRALAQAASVVLTDEDAREAVLLAATELISNGVLHGRPPVVLSVFRPDISLAVLDVVVSDHGSGQVPALPPSRPEPFAEGGRGLWLVSQLAASVSVERGPGLFAVRARFASAPSPRSATA